MSLDTVGFQRSLEKSRVLAFQWSTPHEVHHMLRISLEALPQFRVLGGHAHRTGVLVAGPHHDAAQGQEWGRGEAEFLGTQQGGHDHVAAGLELAIGLQHHAAAQVVHHQDLLGFR